MQYKVQSVIGVLKNDLFEERGKTMTVRAFVTSGVMPGGEKEITIRNCPGVNDLKSVLVFLKKINTTEHKKRIYCTSVYFCNPYLINKNNEHEHENGYGLMRIETKKQSIPLHGTIGDLRAIHALCVGLQENGENSCVYCKAPQRCPVKKLLRELNG